MRPQLESISLELDGHLISGIRQRVATNSNQPAMLCVHGWLDNANSFVPMIPYLPAFDLVAIDLPGHGYSDALVQGYSFHELCYVLTRVIQALNWSQCHLVGHSLGGCIAPMLTVANPSAIESLTLIEAIGPMSEPAHKLPARMTKALHDRLNPVRYSSRKFTSKQAAVDARLKAATMAPASAKLIIDRQLMEIDNEYQWRFDPRWRMASAQYQTEEQVEQVLKAVNCKTMTVIADNGFLASRPETTSRLACLQQHESTTLPGHHHVHMDTPEPVAMLINRFLNATPDLGG